MPDDAAALVGVRRDRDDLGVGLGCPGQVAQGPAGVADDDERIFPNGYNVYDGPLLKAAFNYEFWANEPGSWAHNTHYALQLMYDSIDDLQLSAADNGTPLTTDRLTTPTLLTRPFSD